MQFLVLISVALFSLPLGFATAAAEEEDLGSWTISGFRRDCPAEENQCHFSFILDEDASKAPVQCTYSVDGTDNIPALQLNYRDAACRETADYRLDSGWDENGYTVMTVKNQATEFFAFFGFEDAELVDGAVAEPRSAAVFDGRSAESQPDPESNGGEDLNYAVEWTLMNVTRVAIQGDGHPSMALTFNIEHPGSDSLVCRALFQGNQGQDAKTMSFYAASCGDSEWAVSWGYNAGAEEDVAVMTLMNKYRDRRAYFGFRHVNDGIDLGNNGPEPTYQY